MHTSDDPRDAVRYSTYEAIDYAAGLGFDVLAVTCHNMRAWRHEYATYAASRGILLLSGIELNVAAHAGARGRHVLVIGVDQEAETVHTFDGLAAYREKNPHVLVVAPHPYFYGNFSLQNYLEKYIRLFDAIEHSWFYSARFNRNSEGVRIAERYGLPLVATSDTHFFDFMNENYALVDAEEKTERAVLSAVKRGAVENVTSPRRLISEMVLPEGLFVLRGMVTRAFSGPRRSLFARVRPETH